MNCCEQEEHCKTGEWSQLPAAPKEWFQSKEGTSGAIEHGFLVQLQEAFGCGASLDHILVRDSPEWAIMDRELVHSALDELGCPRRERLAPALCPYPAASIGMVDAGPADLVWHLPGV